MRSAGKTRLLRLRLRPCASAVVQELTDKLDSLHTSHKRLRDWSEQGELVAGDAQELVRVRRGRRVYLPAAATAALHHMYIPSLCA